MYLLCRLNVSKTRLQQEALDKEINDEKIVCNRDAMFVRRAVFG